MTSSFLNIDKPSGMTSHDVVDAVRRVVGQRSVGHTGTLDPFATGVLVLALGRATKLARFLAGADKAYRGQITLGQATTTYDCEGEVTQTGPIDHLDQEGIDAAMGRQRGAIEQVPPAYSAKKVGGKKLYELARRGETVEVEPKPVTVHEFVLEGWEPPLVHFRAVVSSGTYVRSLAHDLGQALGCGAHLNQLARTQVGRHTLEESIPLAELEANPDRLEECLIPITEALPEIPTVTVNPEAERRLINGSPAALVARGIGVAAAEAKRLFALSEDGRLLALVEKMPASPGAIRIQPKVQLTNR
jgi:tRNA pseudouridine55 synthase